MQVEHLNPEKKNTNTIISYIEKSSVEHSQGNSEQSEMVQIQLDRHAKEWGQKTRSHLADAYPYRASEIKLLEWTKQVESEEEHISLMTFTRLVDEFFSFCKQASRYAHEDYWQSVVSRHRNDTSDESQTELPLDTVLLLGQWQKHMDEARTEWEMSEIIRLQESLLKDLDLFIKALEALKKHAHDGDLDPGIFLDLSTATLKPQDIEQLTRWVKYLSENKGVKYLCEVLGKMRDTDVLTQETELKTVIKPQETVNLSAHPNEEIIGIRLGKDIEYALPSELSLLSDPETALLFETKYFESRIMSFDMQGIAAVMFPQKTIEEVPEPEKDNLGPMIICIDTSGSMAGMPETVGKAVTLFMAYKAKAQKRACYLVNFATEIETLDLSDSKAERDLLAFLQMSFHSGTDVAPAIIHSVDMMEIENFKKADVLVISDFIIGTLSLAILEKMAIQREAENRFYSLVIGSRLLYGRQATLFDREWVFDPASSSVYEVGEELPS